MNQSIVEEAYRRGIILMNMNRTYTTQPEPETGTPLTSILHSIRYETERLANLMDALEERLQMVLGPDYPQQTADEPAKGQHINPLIDRLSTHTIQLTDLSNHLNGLINRIVL